MERTKRVQDVAGRRWYLPVNERGGVTGEFVPESGVKWSEPDWASERPDDFLIVRLTPDELRMLANGAETCRWCPEIVHADDESHGPGRCSRI